MTSRSCFRRLLPALAVACTSFLSGCVLVGDKLDEGRYKLSTVPFYVFDNAQGYQDAAQPTVLNEPTNLVVAVSGGGSRSAVFSAAVLEQLAYIPDPNQPSRSVLDGCKAISAVSGGSLSAAYYSLYKPDRVGANEETAKFFQQFKSNMTTDFVTRGFVHYVTHPWEGVLRYYTRYKYGPTLSNTFDDFLFKGATFDNLLERERSGTAPVLMVNAVDLDRARRFVFTNLNTAKSLSVPPASVPSIIKRGASGPGFAVLAQVAATPSFAPIGFDTIDSDIGMNRLATAVTASSAFPVIPGPVSLLDYSTLKTEGREHFVHLADGGVVDNYGIDSLLSLYFADQARSKQRKRLVIVLIDGTAPTLERRDQDPDGYVSAFGYALQSAGGLVTRSETYSRNALSLAGGAVKLIPISVGSSPQAKNLRGSTASYSIPERDMHILLDAAQTGTAEARAAIVSALRSR